MKIKDLPVKQEKIAIKEEITGNLSHDVRFKVASPMSKWEKQKATNLDHVDLGTLD